MYPTPARRLCKMATGKAKNIEEMNVLELAKVMEVLGVSDEGMENLSDARSRVRSAINAAEKTSDWPPGKVRYFSVSESFRSVTSLAGVHQCLSRGATFRDRYEAMRRQTVSGYC